MTIARKLTHAKTVHPAPALCYTFPVNNKSTQTVLIIGIIAVIGGAVYASLSLVKKQPITNTANTNTNATYTQTQNSTLLNFESRLKGNATFSRPFFVPETKSLKVSVIMTSADITVLTPAGIAITPTTASSYNTKYSFDAKTGQAIFTISKPAAGTWQVQLTSTITDEKFFVIKVEAPITAAASITMTKTTVSDVDGILITAKATDNGQPVPGTRWDIIYGPYAGVTPADVQPLVVYDDGQHDDGAANDGIFAASLPTIGITGHFYIEGDVRYPSGLNVNTVTFFDIPLK